MDVYSTLVTGINVVVMNMLLSLTTLNGSSPWASQIRCGAVMWPISGRVSAGRTSPLFSTCSQENQWAGPCRSRRTAGLPWKHWKWHGKPVVSPSGWCSTAIKAVIIRAGSSGSYCGDTGSGRVWVGVETAGITAQWSASSGVWRTNGCRRQAM